MMTDNQILAEYKEGRRYFREIEVTSTANFGGADLTDADFALARLAGANFAKAILNGVNFPGADLCSAELQGAQLLGASLSGTRLDYANLSEARLGGADVVQSSLVRAKLRRADMDSVDLSGSDLSYADLSRSTLRHSNLTAVVLTGAMCESVLLGNTILSDLDIGPLCDAGTDVEFDLYGPCIIDWRTIVHSYGHPRFKEFLQRAGTPEVFIEYLVDCARSLSPKGVFRMLQSTFISYGGPDTAFAKKLNDALLKNGVTTFFFAEDAIPGQKLHRLMREGVNRHDRVILVCSKASLERPGVLNEIAETLQREARDGGREYLIPITLDDYVFGKWEPSDPGIAQAVRDRVVADFKGAESDDAKFNQMLLRLVGALKR